MILSKIRNFIFAPFPTQLSHPGMWKRCLLFSAFVFFFLFAFRPFGISGIEQQFTLTILGYGIICLVMMVVLNIGIPQLAPGFFAENKWTAGKEILWTLVNILLIGLANAIYSAYIGLFSLNLRIALMFEAYTLLIGLIPVLVTVLLRQERLERSYENQSDVLNKAIDRQQSNAGNNQTHAMIDLRSENTKDNIRVASTDLVFIRSADNYVEVFFIDNQELRQKLIRSSMKEIAGSLGQYPQFFRCHKSFLVNLEKVRHVSGNAQGLKLHLQDMDELVPVSRNFTKTIREKLAVRP